MEKSQKNASYEAVYSTLRERILRLDLNPGASVSETETAAEFSVSRTPVRDAFKALVSEGLLEVKPHIGTFVTRIDMNEITDLLYIREVMEKSIATELTATFNQSQEFKLRLILQNQENLIQRNDLSVAEFGKEFARTDNEFHQTLFTLAGHGRIVTYFNNISAQYERYRTFLNCEDKEGIYELYKQHLNILEYMKKKDVEALHDLITHHIYDGINNHANLIYDYPNYFKTI